MSVSMKFTFTPTTEWLMWRISVTCFGAVGLALITQYGFDMHPCPWCCLQRLFYVMIGLMALSGALVPSLTARKTLAGGCVMLAVFGALSALWQQFGAANSESCSQSMADKILSALGLSDAMPSIFEATATCADAAVDLLGIPYALWSLALFIAVGVACTHVVRLAK